MDVSGYLREKARAVEAALDGYLEQNGTVPETILEAMRYSVFAGGKRLRPILAIATAETLEADPGQVMPTACALEMIHTYSLIHDDLPSMDDDDLRRGKPTCHKVFGEAVAILAGDALLTEAFRLVAENATMSGVDCAGAVAATREIAEASGAAGMVGGQVLDLEAEGKDLSIEELRRLHSKKTGALIRAAVRAAAILSGATDEQLPCLTAFAEKLGLAFQIIDDVLDEEGDTASLGKTAGKDAAQHKATFPALLGLEASKARAAELVESAKSDLEMFGPSADALRSIAEFVVDRSS
jgi:geranylgeranyl diphosphate synthase type II